LPQHLKKSAYLWLFGCVGWALLVLWLSLTPHPPRFRMPVLSWDKFQHCASYALLTLLAGRSAVILRPGRGWNWLLAGGSVLAFGSLIEGLQFLTHKGRTADFRDILANATGILVVCLLAALWRRFGPAARLMP
jgi:VanZ family protein